MTKLLSAVVFVSVFLASCQSSEKQQQGDPIAAAIDSLLNTVPDFSGVILFADHGKPILQKAYGVRDYDSNTPIQLDDIFELASVSKQFTAMTIMMLKEEGKLNYDDSLTKFLPNLPYTGITIRHLLTHTSGLPDYQAVMDAHWDKSKAANNQDIMEYLIKYNPPIMFAPGEKYMYSNTGYVFLASISEVASGKDFVELCRQRIFPPLRMNSTGIRSNNEKLKLTNLAHGNIFSSEQNRFIRADSFPSSNYIMWLGGRKGPGRVSSTAADLLKWDSALYADPLISQETLSDAFTPYTLNDGSKSNYGFGWEIMPSSPAGKIVWHNGDNPGYKTIIVRYIDQDKTLIMLNNNYHKRFEEIRATIDNLVAKYTDQ